MTHQNGTAQLSRRSLILGGLFVGGLVLTAFLVALFHHFLLMTVDEQSHMNFARLVSDSITPGVSQLGFWPPLLHSILALFASQGALYHSGIAGVFAVAPFLFLGAFFIYRIVEMLSRKREPALVAVLIYVLNPYILYYSVTPMMEIPFLALFLGVLYFALSWLRGRMLSHLLLGALFVSLASLARFEGLALIPGYALVLAYGLSSHVWKKSTEGARERTHAYALSSLVAPLLLCGVSIIFLYGFVYADNMLEFVNGKWSSLSQQQLLDLPSHGSIMHTLLYFFHATEVLFGTEFLVIGLFVFALLGVIMFLFLKERKGESAVILILSLLPTGFILSSLYTGHAVIYTEDLPPYKELFNARYALILLPSLTIWGTSFLGSLHPRKSLGIHRAILWWMVLLSAFFCITELLTPFSAITTETKNVRPWNEEQRVIGALLCQKELAGTKGYTLMTRGILNNIPISSCAPLRTYIVESNAPYYQLANERPWLFARTVVLLKDGADAFSRSADTITATWSGNPLFAHFYEPIGETNRILLYRLRRDRVLSYAQYFSLPPQSIPSLLSGDNAPLDPHFYQSLGLSSAEELVLRDAEYQKTLAPKLTAKKI